MMNIELEKIQLDNVGFLRYRQLRDQYLLTNETGESIFLGKKEFKDFIEGRLDRNSLTYGSLERKNFIHNTIDRKEEALRYRQKYAYLRHGTSLHIIIPTMRCNHQCVYCQVNSHPQREKGCDMDKKTARRVVDAIFQSPSKNLTIEFQGGEPLLNWDIITFIIQYAASKNRTHKKKLYFVVVSNLTLMTKERLRFLFKNNVSICTSLDGPKFIHDRNRPMTNGKSGYDLTTKWIKEIAFSKTGFGNALATLPRSSLKYPEEIIHEYLKWGMFGIPLRPVSILGLGGVRRNEIGITAEQYLDFYRHALDYMIKLTSITSHNISERMTKVCLQKIFSTRDPGYADMRSPCGAGCGQLAYYHDGSVYTCDEARMLGDDSFKLGNVNTHSYQELMQSQKMKTLVFASCIDGLYCDYCAYKPYCGVCPVLNWKECGTLYAQMGNSFMCQVYQGIYDYLFETLQNKKKEKILRSWISN